MKHAIGFTNHAVVRFVDRHAPQMSFEEAAAHLREVSADAVQLRERTLHGELQYRINDPRCVLVVKRDRRLHELVCVTVLPEREVGGGLTEAEAEIVNEWLEEHAQGG